MKQYIKESYTEPLNIFYALYVANLKAPAIEQIKYEHIFLVNILMAKKKRGDRHRERLLENQYLVLNETKNIKSF